MWLAAAAKLLQSCPTLCDPIDSSPSGSLVPGILQRRTLEWVAISFSNAWKRKMKVKLLSRIQLLANPWTAAYQAPLAIGFSRQEYWVVCHCLLQTICLLSWNLEFFVKDFCPIIGYFLLWLLNVSSLLYRFETILSDLNLLSLTFYMFYYY